MTSKYSFEDSKYVITNDNGITHCLRYGETWRDLTGDKLIGAMLNEIERLQEALAEPSAWIAVGNRLPTDKAEYIHNVLVCNRYGNRAIATYDGYAKYFDLCGAALGGHEVTFWQLLPEAPTKEPTP